MVLYYVLLIRVCLEYIYLDVYRNGLSFCAIFNFFTNSLCSDLPGFLTRLQLNTPDWVREALAEFMGTFILLV